MQITRTTANGHLGSPDATVLATVSEGTILVVSAGRTRQEWIQQARDQLLAQQSGNLLGLAVNRAQSAGNHRNSGPKRANRKLRRNRTIGDKDWLNLEEAAACLGISKAMARRWCKAGHLTKKGALLWLRVSGEDVDRLIQVHASGETNEASVEV